jgi:predicted ATPase/class 3 adenylate cyclase
MSLAHERADRAKPTAGAGAGASLPEGTLTFLLTDIEGSTRLWESRPDGMRRAMRRHDAIIGEAVRARQGRIAESGREGDSVMAVFMRATDAVAATLQLQLVLNGERWPQGCRLRVRAALHTGEAELREAHYYGPALYRCARLLGIAHGGQSLVSLATQQLVRASLPPGAAMRDLGSHRLKDLSLPEHVFQLEHENLPTSFPPLRSLDVGSVSLPAPVSSFVNREQELEELRAMQSVYRLVTLTGPGGSGKTRLALELAAGLGDRYPDGVLFVELATISDPRLVPATVARALQVREQTERSLSETLTRHLAPMRLLLVLDNCEHVVEAAAVLTAELLRSCPEVRVLATSRQLLGLSGEAVAPVAPLELPDSRTARSPESLLECPSARLFAERAGPRFRLKPGETGPLAHICNQLEGIPLAIELAASRAPALPIAEMARRLDARLHLLTGGGPASPPRHRTMEAAIAWSHDLLSSEEAILFRRVCVFAGGFDLVQAETICSDPSLPAGRVLDVLGGLVAKSFFNVADGRHRILETIREYGRARLEEAGEVDACHRRLAEHLRRLAPELPAMLPADRLDLLELELNNLRAALDWCESADPELGLALAAGFYDALHLRGHVSEGRQRLESLLSKAGEGSDASVHGHLAVSRLAYLQADPAAAQEHVDRYLSTVRDRGDRRGIAEGMIVAGQLALFNGRLQEAESCFSETLAIRRELDDLAGEAYALHYLGTAHAQAGDVDEARAMFGRSLAIRDELGSRDQGLVTMTFVGAIDFALGYAAAAWPRLMEALEVAGRLGDRRAAWAVDVLAWMAARQSDHHRALRLAGAASAMHEASGTRPPPNWQSLMENSLTRARAVLGAAALDAWDEGRAMSFEQALDYGRSGPPPEI